MFLRLTLIAVLLSSNNFASASETTLNIASGKIHLEFFRAKQEEWVRRAATAISKFYGRYPVDEVWISITKKGSGKNINGTTWSGRKIELRLGREVTDEELETDWTATHEMFHLAFPQVGDEYNWMSEGLATYLEPLARARVGDLKPEKVWKDMMWGLPKGLPQSSDQGLNITHTWGRTYWGGALFWFAADIEIREKSKNIKSLDDALRAILKAGGDGSSSWEAKEIISAMDKATGLTVLKDIFDRMATHPGKVDLDEMWKRLGVSHSGQGKIEFNDKAPLAEIRKSLTDSNTQRR